MSKDENLQHLRHSLAHLLAAAVLDIYPDAKPTIGPAVENGFYYDFDFSPLGSADSRGPHADKRGISENDLGKIEKKMKELLPAWTSFERVEASPAEAKEKMQANPYKLELIEELEKSGEPITFYKSGDFADLCRGGHVDNPAKDINPKAFKLDRLAGAYWRGDEKNKMLTRIYGLAFESREELGAYEKQRQEAEKRDHRLLGKQLDLFSQHPFSPGAIFWHPKGMVLWRELEKHIREKNDRYGYGEVSTPIMVKKELFETSGHWQHYRDNGFWFDIDKETYVLKPMNCPESTLIYSNALRSYRDLPLRFSEPTGRLHRRELTGVVGGLFRVMQLTQDDAHVYCRPDQIESEINALLNYVNEIYEIFNLPVTFGFATKPEKAMGSDELWQKAEKSLESVLKKSGFKYELKPKDGAFYGPKIDIHAKDAIGREHQLATIQLDFQMPEKFELEYIDEDGKAQRPVMIHRAILGSFERFLGVLIEHFAGAFPVWLSPVQAMVLSISEKHTEYAHKVADELRNSNIRVETDERPESIGKKIREAAMQKVPYMLIVGDKEIESKSVAVRARRKSAEASGEGGGEKDLGTMEAKEFVKMVSEEIKTKAL